MPDRLLLMTPDVIMQFAGPPSQERLSSPERTMQTL